MDQFDYLINEFVTDLAIDGFFYGEQDEVIFRKALENLINPMLKAFYEAGLKAQAEQNG